MLLQVCISFSIHQDNIVLPKSVTPSRIMENLKACELRLDAEDMQRLSELRSRKARYVHVSLNDNYNIYKLPFTVTIYIILCVIMYIVF